MPIAYVSPFTNTTNEYINRVKSIVGSCGYEVQPLSFKTLFSRRVLGLFNRSNVVLVHWLESRIFTDGRSRPVVSFSGSVQFLVYLFFLAVMRARFMYFMHDHAVHDVTGWRRDLSVVAINFLARLADVRIVHDPSYCDQYSAIYLPHPLYRDGLGDRLELNRYADGFRAGVLGALRPYKRIEKLIDAWPKGVALSIRGRADPDYAEIIKQRIDARDDRAYFQLTVGFMSREDFEATLGKLDALILPHSDESALVSGAFFEAIGAVPFVIARRSPFIVWASKEFEGVYAFDTEGELAAVVKSAAQKTDAQRAKLPQLAALADSHFGYASCVKLYGEVLLGLQN